MFKLYLRPKSLLVFFLTLILGYYLAESYVQTPGAYHPLSAAKTTTPPNFTLKNLSGQTVSLSDYRGKYVFLNFWATWCFPCREEMPSMDSLYKKFRSNRFEMLAVALDRQGERMVKPFVKNFGFSFPILLDAENQTTEIFGVVSIPATFILNPEGEIVEAVHGSRDWSKEEVFKFFEDLLKDHEQGV